MMRAVGLRTHIWNNAIKSLLLLAGFPVLLLLVLFAVALLIETAHVEDVYSGLQSALYAVPGLVPWAVLAALVWFVIAFFINTRVIDGMTGARAVSRQENPRLYNLLENLCISRGLPMPQLHIIDTAQLNAFASGVTRKQYTVTVTQGLLDALDDDELEAVLAHELTHIMNGDVRLLMVATIFVGIISLLTDGFGRRGLGRSGGAGPRPVGVGRSYGGAVATSSGGRSGNNKNNGGAVVILIIIAVVCLLLARLLAVVIRLALSRRREFMADAGAVELTRNPDAMISALRKIEAHSYMEDMPGDLRAMLFNNGTPDGAPRSSFANLFATHPPIASRVAALVTYAGGRESGIV